MFKKKKFFFTIDRNECNGPFLLSGPMDRANGSRSAAHRKPTSVRRVAPRVHSGRRAGALASTACRRRRPVAVAVVTTGPVDSTPRALVHSLRTGRPWRPLLTLLLSRARASSTVARLRRPAPACPERSLRCRRRHRLSARVLVSSPSGQSVVRSTAGRYDMLASVPSAAADRGQQERITRRGSSSGRRRRCGVIVA